MILWAILLFGAADYGVFNTAYAADLSKPIKILGRGIRNKETQEILQLACVGTPRQGESEANCDQVQFLYSAVHEPALLLGQPFFLDLDSPNGPAKQLREIVKEKEKSELLIANKNKLQEIFPTSYAANGTVKITDSLLGIGATAVTLVILQLVFNKDPNMIKYTLLVSATTLLYYGSMTMDLFTLPVRALSVSFLTNQFVEAFKNADELSNRDLIFWQERAKAVAAKTFRTLFSAVQGSDQSVFNSASQGCKVATRVRADQTWQTYIRWRQNYSTTQTLTMGQYFIELYSEGYLWKKYQNWAPDPKQILETTTAIVNGQVRGTAFLADSEADADYILEITASSKTHSVKKRKFCFEGKMLSKSGEVKDDWKFCSRVPSVLVGRLGKKLPSCSDLNRL